MIQVDFAACIDRECVGVYKQYEHRSTAISSITKFKQVPARRPWSSIRDRNISFKGLKEYLAWWSGPEWLQELLP